MKLRLVTLLALFGLAVASVFAQAPQLRRPHRPRCPQLRRLTGPMLSFRYRTPRGVVVSWPTLACMQATCGPKLWWNWGFQR